jgi:hypothetical protein
MEYNVGNDMFPLVSVTLRFQHHNILVISWYMSLLATVRAQQKRLKFVNAVKLSASDLSQIHI